MAETATQIPLSYESHAYLNITPADDEQYEEIGEGITNLTPTQNPQTSTKQYIHEVNGTTSVTALQKQYAYSGERVVGDPVNDFLASLEDKVGENVRTTMIVANGWEKAESPASSLKAKKYDVVIAVSSAGDRAGGSTLSISGTIYTNGDPIEGTFNPSTKAFTAAGAA